MNEKKRSEKQNDNPYDLQRTQDIQVQNKR